MEELTDSIIEDVRDLLVAVKGELENFTDDELTKIRTDAYTLLCVVRYEVDRRKMKG
jgi:hypothetical protein